MAGDYAGLLKLAAGSDQMLDNVGSGGAILPEFNSPAVRIQLN